MLLGLQVSDTMYWPFKSANSVSYSSLALLGLSPADGQSQMIQELVSQVQIPKAGDT